MFTTMITINNEKKQILDLNQYIKYNEFKFDVQSKNGDSMLVWGVDSIFGDSVLCKVDADSLLISLDVSKVLSKTYVVLRNVKNECAIVEIVPNKDEIGEKKYIFRVNKTNVDGRVVAMNIVSKRNNKNWNWEVSYKGEPMTYEFKVTKTKLLITNIGHFDKQASSHIELLQDDSHKKIVIELLHKTCEETEILKIEEN